jgi:hypothetical protein
MLDIIKWRSKIYYGFLNDDTILDDLNRLFKMDEMLISLETLYKNPKYLKDIAYYFSASFLKMSQVYWELDSEKFLVKNKNSVEKIKELERIIEKESIDFEYNLIIALIKKNYNPWLVRIKKDALIKSTIKEIYPTPESYRVVREKALDTRGKFINILSEIAKNEGFSMQEGAFKEIRLLEQTKTLDKKLVEHEVEEIYN